MQKAVRVSSRENGLKELQQALEQGWKVKQTTLFHTQSGEEIVDYILEK